MKRHACFEARMGLAVSIFVVACSGLSGCGRFFKDTSLSTTKITPSSNNSPPPGGKAGSLNAAALASVHGVTTSVPPAAVRPDPDLFVRRLLRQYRDEGAIVAREIGRVEAYRLLLGGATEDFRTNPQETYDATSLLAAQTVSEEVCQGLVAPDATNHPGWKTILPAATSNVSENVKFLAQRFLGLPASRISAETLAALETLVNDAKVRGSVTLDSYIPACVALLNDAEALLL